MVYITKLLLVRRCYPSYKSRVSVVSAQEGLPKMGYFHKSMPNNMDIPPHKIAGTFCLKNLSLMLYA